MVSPDAARSIGMGGRDAARNLVSMRFVIIGGGPAGNQAATHAARLGVDVTLVERDVIGGAANLRDCIPSKAMIAAGGALFHHRRIAGMGVTGAEGAIDLELLRNRIRDDHRSARGLQRGDPPQPTGRAGPRDRPSGRPAHRGRRDGRGRTRLRGGRDPRSAPAAVHGSPTGPPSTATASSPPATPTRHASSPTTSSWWGRA